MIIDPETGEASEVVVYVMDDAEETTVPGGGAGSDPFLLVLKIGIDLLTALSIDNIVIEYIIVWYSLNLSSISK